MKVVYKVTFPNGKIYVGQDLTDTLTYMGSFDRALVARDFTPEMRRDFTLRKQILWESDRATKSEIDAMERHFIVTLAANDPNVGYNRTPRFSGVEVSLNQEGEAQ